MVNFSHLLKKKGKVSRAVDDLYGTLKFARKFEVKINCDNRPHKDSIYFFRPILIISHMN